MPDSNTAPSKLSDFCDICGAYWPIDALDEDLVCPKCREKEEQDGRNKTR